MSAPNSRAEVVLERFEAGDYLGIAEVVCPQERKGAEVTGSSMVWDSRPFGHFVTPIALENVQFNGDITGRGIAVSQACFHVFGDDEMYLVVNRQNQAFVRSDPLSRDVVRIFAEAYAVHPHLLCLESLRHQRTEIVERLARAAREQRSHRHGYQVKLNGVVQPNM